MSSVCMLTPSVPYLRPDCSQNDSLSQDKTTKPRTVNDGRQTCDRIRSYTNDSMSQKGKQKSLTTMGGEWRTVNKIIKSMDVFTKNSGCFLFTIPWNSRHRLYTQATGPCHGGLKVTRSPPKTDLLIHNS